MVQLETLRFTAAHAARIDVSAAMGVAFEDGAADRRRNRAYAPARQVRRLGGMARRVVVVVRPAFLRRLRIPRRIFVAGW
jgi:hypothetical protein